SRPIACTRSRKQAYPPVSLRRDSKWRFVAPERTATRLHGFSRFNRPRFGAHSGNFSSLPCAEFAAGVPLEACAGIIPIIMSAGFTVQEFAGITFAKQSWRAASKIRHRTHDTPQDIPPRYVGCFNRLT